MPGHGMLAPRRWRLHEPRPTGLGCEGSRAVSRARRIQAFGGNVAGRRADHADQSAWRAVSCRGKARDPHDAARRLRLGVRRPRRPQTREHSGRGRADVAATGQRTIRSRSRALSLRLALRREENPGAHRAPAENRETLTELKQPVPTNRTKTYCYND